MRKPNPWYALVLLTLLSACGTTPSSNYYLLTARADRQPRAQ